jgi:hypothetical protein
VDVRVIAATNEDLLARTRSGTFREDLYYRLKMGWLPIPPLRERKEDIPALVRRFLDLEGQSQMRVDERVLAELTSREWPGNVRELRNTLTYMLAVRDGRDLAVGDLPGDGYFGEQHSRSNPGIPGSVGIPSILAGIPKAGRESGTWAGKETGGASIPGIDPASEGGAPWEMIHRETLEVLALVAELDAEGASAGRESVATLASDKGLRLGSGSVRARLAELERLGLVEIRRGRLGTRLTENGRELLGKSGLSGFNG